MNQDVKTLWGVSIGHAAHDTWYGVAPLMLAVLSGPMHISNSEIGLFLLFYQGISSLAQPFFGRLTERIGGRPLAVASILWTTLLFSGILFSPSKWLIAVLISLAGFGSAAWHPQGAANATVAGGGRRGATAASVFFLGGTLGSSLLGAFVGGQLLDAYGRPALLALSVVTIALALTVVRRLVPLRVDVSRQRREAAPMAQGATSGNGFVWLAGLFLVSTALRALMYHSLNAYVPKLEQDLGVSAGEYGTVMSLYMAAQAVGGVAGAYLADRVGLRAVLVGSMVLAAAVFYPFLSLTGVASYAFLIASGLFFGPSHTLLIVAGQRRFPDKMVVVTGLLMGFTFVSGAGGAWVLGLVSQKTGLLPALAVLPWGLLGAAALSWVTLPRDHKS